MIFRLINKKLNWVGVVKNKIKMANRIYTKRGDKGVTSIIGNKSISKASTLMEAIGTVDELNCHIGLIKSSWSSSFLTSIQNDLFVIGSFLGGANVNLELETRVWNMENEMDAMSSVLNPLKNFILPDGDELVCNIHISRAVCRRAERAINGSDVVEHDEMLKYINRLSDYLFVLARFVSMKRGLKETVWKGN